MRCSSCARFVSREPTAEWDTEPEINSEDRLISAGIRLILACATCGEELADAVVEAEVSVNLKPVEMDEVFDDDIQVSDDHIGSDKDGKPYPARYQKPIYWASVELTVYNKNDGSESVYLITDPIQASHFERLNY